MPMGDEAHQPPGLEPIEAIAEEVWMIIVVEPPKKSDPRAPIDVLTDLE